MKIPKLLFYTFFPVIFFGIAASFQLAFSIAAREVENKFHKTMAYIKWKKVDEYCSFEPALYSVLSPNKEQEPEEYFPIVIFANNPEGILKQDTADVGKSLLNLSLTSQNYRFYGTHVNFTGQFGTYEVRISNSGTRTLELQLLRQSLEKSVQGQLAIARALNSTKLKKKYLLQPGETIALIKLARIPPGSFWSAWSEFLIVRGKATFQELFFNQEATESLVSLKEFEVNNDTSRTREPITHKGFSTVNKISLGKTKVVITEESQPGILYFINPNARIDWGQSNCPELTTLHKTLVFFALNQVKYFVPGEKKQYRVNSAGWAIPHTYKLDIDNQTSSEWLIEFHMKPVKHQVRFVYQISQRQDSFVPWKPYLFTQSKNAEIVESIVIPPGKSEINVKAILAGPSYGRVKNELVFKRKDNK